MDKIKKLQDEFMKISDEEIERTLKEFKVPSPGEMEKPGSYIQTTPWKKVEENRERNDIVIIPVGSTELHGPHANTGEDTFLVTRMAEALRRKTGVNIVMPVHYGSHPYHHMGMPGNVIVPEEYFIGQLKAIMAGLWNAGFRKQILLNGHGQEYVIPTAIHQFEKQNQLPGIFINLNWYHAIPTFFRTKEEGGPYETNFIHADEVETSWSLLLFPEMIDMKYAVDTKPYGFLPDGHVDKAGNLLNRPIKWYGQAGCGPLEIRATPEGVVGRAKLADAKKARRGVAAFLKYAETLINDILATYPPGKVPPVTEMTLRTEAEMEPYIKKPGSRGWEPVYGIPKRGVF